MYYIYIFKTFIMACNGLPYPTAFFCPNKILPTQLVSVVCLFLFCVHQYFQPCHGFDVAKTQNKKVTSQNPFANFRLFSPILAQLKSKDLLPIFANSRLISPILAFSRLISPFLAFSCLLSFSREGEIRRELARIGENWQKQDENPHKQRVTVNMLVT